MADKQRRSYIKVRGETNEISGYGSNPLSANTEAANKISESKVNTGNMPSDIKTLVRERFLNDMVRQVRATSSAGAMIMLVDKHSIKVLSSVVKMHDVVDDGVALIESIEKSRRPLPDLDAVYFLTPTEASITQLNKDYEKKKKNLYRNVHLFFTSHVNDQLMGLLQGNANLLDHVETFVELNIEFVVQESRVFDFNSPLSFNRVYSSMSEAGAQQEEASLLARKLVTVCMTLGEDPAIRYNSNHQFGKMVSFEVQRQLDQAKRSIDSFPPATNREKATLLILERKDDLISPLTHEYTYQSMIYDHLDIHNNTYKRKVKKQNNKEEDKPYLITESDHVMADLRHMHIKDAMRHVSNNFNQVQKANEKIDILKKKKAEGQDTTKLLVQAMKNMPDMQEGVSKWAAHIDMAQDIMKKLNAIKGQELIGAEQSVITGVDANGSAVKALQPLITPIMRDPSIDEMLKIRLLMMYAIAQGGMTAEERDSFFGDANLTASASVTLNNLSELGVQVIKSSNKNKVVQNKRNTRQVDPSVVDTRWVPNVKMLGFEVFHNKLPDTAYPYTGEAPRSKASPQPKAEGRSARSWANKDPGQAEKQVQKAAAENGRLIIFVIGGIGYSEIRSAYELSRDFKRDVVIGSTAIMKPNDFVDAIHNLKPSTSSGL